MALPYQVGTEDVEETAQTKSRESCCRQDRLEEVSPRGWIPVRYFGAELFDPLFFFKVPIESGLKCSMHSVLLVRFEQYKPERLGVP